MTSLARRSLAALDAAVARLDAGEDRPGQREMCAAVAEALEEERHLLVEAGTGVGKSLAYLIPALLSEKRVVVATATKALQDQLARKDLPFLATALPDPFTAAVLKGRSNYLCLARLAEAVEAGREDDQLRLVPASRLQDMLPRLADWALTAEAGEEEDLPVALPAPLWRALTVGPDECPGSRGCPQAVRCFAERAREEARVADLVVVNTHLYCLDLVAGGGLLGDHDAVIVDEAHTLEDVAATTFGLSVGAARFRWLAGRLRGLLVREAKEIEALERLATALEGVLGLYEGRRVDPTDEMLATALGGAHQVLAEILKVLRGLEVSEVAEAKRIRVLQAADTLAREVAAASTLEPGQVAWVNGNGGLTLSVAPVDVGPVLAERLFSDRTVVATSATLSVGGSLEPTAWTLGLREGEASGSGREEGGPGGGREGRRWRGLRVASPFDYQSAGLLYCAAHLPDPRRSEFLPAAIAEMAGLIEAAGGRTLALFTSYAALHAAASELRDRWSWPVFVQDDAPRHRVLGQMRDDEQSCLFATLAFWQGVDVPGDALRLVVIDKLPFGRPDEPLTQARREAAEALGRRGFEAVDLPRATRLLAQGVGRLIRATTDRGVVAVLDPRLARARYRKAILDSLPPLRRTVDGDEARAFLAALGH